MNDFLQSLRNGQAEKQRTPKTRKNFDNSYHYTSGPRFNSYGGGGYQNNRSQQMKRPHPPQGNQMPMDDSATTSMLAEAIETLGLHIETLAKNQEYLINAQERTADMMERQAVAIERIVTHLNIAPASTPENMHEENIFEKNNVPQKTFENHYVTSQKPETKPETPEPVAKIKAKPVQKPVKQPIEKAVKTAKQVIRRRKKIVSSQSKEAVTTSTDGSKLLGRDKIMDIIQTMRADGATFDQVAGRLVELGQPTFSGRGEWHAQTIHRLCNKK
ncbi:MAG: hypothetical protein L3J69_19240 [Desulfobacula sp.]|nr:hypothetical protein [Desulfobacula sp.]